MGIALGIHVGHHAACAVVVDGVLRGAVQLERLSRRKHHPIRSLSDELPIDAVLETVGATMNDVDAIVTSVQGGVAGGFGLDHPLIEPTFTKFDPLSERHFALSHHRAHAYCAAGYAPPADIAVIVCDLAGSSTESGEDFDLPFGEWQRSLTTCGHPVQTQSECLSIYCARLNGDFDVVDREFVVPHPQRDCGIWSVASLYENVAHAVFRRRNAHGSLMALAAFSELDPDDAPPMLSIDGDRVCFRNDWQHEVYRDAQVDPETGTVSLSRGAVAALAARCQSATEAALLAYARRAKRLCGTEHVALAGGTFLNILGNSEIARSGLFATVDLPSAPHDAGIAIGCALRGAERCGDRPRRIETDRLGPVYVPDQVHGAIANASPWITSKRTTPEEVARLLVGGSIIARCAGRSEFGPRALGGRSLLASPALGSSKRRLNEIKSRQPWRPVAPIVAADHLAPALEGPANSPWMTFTHEITEPWRQRLPALSHPDRSTRAQTLRRAEDPWLFDLLLQVEQSIGVAILCNTSFNGPGEPIIETPAQAIQWFLEHEDVDHLLLDDTLVSRALFAELDRSTEVRTSDDAYLLLGPARDSRRSVSLKVGDEARAVVHERLQRLAREPGSSLKLSDVVRTTDPALCRELTQLWIRGFLVASPTDKTAMNTTRLHIEPLRPDHAAACFGPLSDDRLYAYIPDGKPADVDELADLYARLTKGPPAHVDERWLNWVVRDRESSAPIGTLQATVQPSTRQASIAYIVFAEHWRQGFATEAVNWLLRHLRCEHGIDVCSAEVDSRNEASLRLAERVGMRRHGTEKTDEGVDVIYRLELASVSQQPPVAS